MRITDNASNLNNRMMDQLCQQFKIQHHNSAPYRPKMNGAVEAANKNVKNILSKMTETYKDWHEHLPYALCAYRTSVRTSVGATPYSLVYGMEAVLPVEVEIPSLRILSQTQLEEAKWAQARYEQLNFIDEKRLAALCHGQLYQRRIERAYNKKARPCTFQPGDLVLKKRNMALSDPRGKFAPSYEGPYVSTPAEKSYFSKYHFIYFYFSLISTPIWRVLCVISISFPFRDTSRHQPWEILRCDWAPTSNRFDLI